MHHLRRNGKLVAVMTDDAHRLTPELDAQPAEDLARREISALCEALLDAKAITGEFVPVGIGLRRP